MNLLPDPQKESPPALRYAFAVAATAAAVLLGLLLRPLIQPSVLSPFFLAVAIAALYGGIGPAVVASLLSVAALNYWFFPPLHTLGIGASADIARVLVFLVVAAVITWLASTVRNQRRKEMQAGAVLRANEEALRQVTTRVALALRGSDIGIWDIELPDGVFENGRVIFTNVWEQLGYEPPYPASGLVSSFSLSHPDDDERVKESFRAYLAGETPQLEFEHRLRHKNGSYRTMLVRGVAIRDSSGKPIRLIGSRVDITERKRSEQALHVSEERFRLATEALAGFLWDWDPVSDQIECIGHTEDVLGFRADEIPREAAWWRNRIHPEDAVAAAQARAAVLSGETLNLLIEYRIQHREGHYVDVVNRCHVVCDATGRVVRVVGGISDITGRRRWEREREDAGKALQASEERFRIATEALAGFLFDWDPVAKQLKWFGGMEEVLGFRLDEVTPDAAWYEARVHPDDLPNARELQREAFESAAAGYVSVYRLLHRDGHYVHVAERARIVRDRTGRPIRVLGGISDISERMRAEEALRQVTSRVDVALGGSDIGIWELELPDGILENGRVIFTNVWEQLGYGHPQAGPDFDSAINLSHPDDRERQKEHFRAYLAGETQHLEFEHRLRHKNGSYRTVLVRGVAIREPGKLVRVIGSRVDITERKRSEQALHVSEERFRLASEALAAFLYEWDPITNHLEWFGGMKEVLGFSLDEVSPDLAWYESRMHPDDLAQAWQSARAALEGDARGYTIMYRFRHRDGHYVHVADRSRIVRDEAGRAIRVLGGVSDISARLRLEGERAELLERERAARAAAEAATRHRDDVLGVVSHDLRNPLAAISICASAVSQSLAPSFESAQHMLASIKHAADSTERLIRDLMDVASIEAGRLAVEPHAEAPANMLEQAADMLAAMASARGVVLETRTTPDLPAVHADAERVLQGLANLVTNSLRFTEPGGHITLRAEPDPAGVRFAVEDTGSGITSEDLPHVFDRFWQRQHGNGGGSGLGLSIVRGIVDAHGGQVMAESTPGKGSRFSFTLPTAN